MNKIFVALLLLVNGAVVAQPGPGPGITGKISGTLMDSASSESLPFAAVVVRNPKTQKDVNGTITNDDGSFKIIDIPVGTYDVLISFVGYEPKTVKVELTPKSPDVSLGNVILVSTSQQLDAVVVEGQRDLIENRVDKIVYNAEQDIANAGGDATDVLRRTPLLNVDLEGNVQLRGNSNIQILINGKPSSMFASSPADALKIIPADQIKSVEVITSPSAKYDGEGSAGIINIITKKGNAEGISGNANVSVGTRQNNAGLGLNAGKGRFGLNASGNMFYATPRKTTSTFFRSNGYGDDMSILDEEGEGVSSRLGVFGNIGAFYDFNAFHSVNTAFRLRGFQMTNDGDFTTNYLDPSRGIDQQYLRTSDNNMLFSGYEWSLDYRMKFPEQPDRELTVAYKIDGNIQDQKFVITQEDLEGNNPDLFRDERNFNDGDNVESTFQVDYAHPLNGGKTKIEAGAKAVLRDAISDFSYETRDDGAANYTVDENKTDIFNYGQDVYAGYLSANSKFGEKTELIAGVRYEQTQIEGDYFKDETTFGNSYNNWLPSITLSRKIGKFNNIKASYSQRIQRPGLQYINPYVQEDNNRNITLGNPALKPEITEQYEVSYSSFVKGFSLNTSAYYRHTTDIIERFLEIRDDGVSENTFQNLGVQNSLGLNVFVSTTLFEIWTLRGGADVFSYNVSGVVNGVELSNDAILWNGNINSNIKLKNSWTIDMFGFYRARRQTLQGYNPSFSIFGMGIQREIWDQKGSIGLRIIEPFFENKIFGSELIGEGFVQKSEFVLPFRSFGINFSYKFGKMDYKKKERRSVIDNKDQKDGGDGQQQQQF